MKKKIRLGLLISTITFFSLFLVSLINPFRNDDINLYKVGDYYRIDMAEKESNDEDYLQIKIANISGSDIYNTEIVFGTKSNAYAEDNFIWFRIIKVFKDDVITIKFYEDTGIFKISSTQSTQNNAAYNISISPKAPNLDIERCMKISHIIVEEDVEPVISKIRGSYWTIDKTIFASLTFISLLGFGYVYLVKKEGHYNEKTK